MCEAFFSVGSSKPALWATMGGGPCDPPEEPEPRSCGMCDEWESCDGEFGICRAKAYEWEQRALLPGTTTGDDPELAAEFAMQWVLGHLVYRDEDADGCTMWREED